MHYKDYWLQQKWFTNLGSGRNSDSSRISSTVALAAVVPVIVVVVTAAVLGNVQ